MSGSAIEGGPVTRNSRNPLLDLEDSRSYHQLAVDAIVQYNLAQYDSTGVDLILKEVPYKYTLSNSPEESDHLISHEKGEFDVALVDIDNSIVRYIEVKSTEKRVERAEKQLKRCEESFRNARDIVPGFDWEMMGTVVLATNIDEDYLLPEEFDDGSYYCSADSALKALESEDFDELSEHIFDEELSLRRDRFMEPFEREKVERLLEEPS